MPGWLLDPNCVPLHSRLLSNCLEAEALRMNRAGDQSLRHRNSQNQRLHLDKVTGCSHQPKELTRKQTQTLSFHRSNTAKHSGSDDASPWPFNPPTHNPKASNSHPAGRRKGQSASASPIQVQLQRTGTTGGPHTGHNPAEPEAARQADQAKDSLLVLIRQLPH